MDILNIMANKMNTVMYIGAMANLKQRVFRHRNNFNPNSFSARYRLHKLVYFEVFDNLEYTFERERKIKFMNRKEKKELISSFNPKWRNLYLDLSEN